MQEAYEQEETATTEQKLTFGQKAVGLTFNPSGDVNVNDIKKQYALIIDTLNLMREDIKKSEDDGQNGERIRLLSISITEAQSAQMWAVKAITWK